MYPQEGTPRRVPYRGGVGEKLCHKGSYHCHKGKSYPMDGNNAFEDKKPEGGQWTETACNAAGGTFRPGLQRSEIEFSYSIRSSFNVR